MTTPGVPFNETAEQSVLGGLLNDPAVFDVVALTLNASDFQDPGHAVIFGAIEAMVGAAQAVDVVTVADWLEVRGELKMVGGLASIGELAHNTVAANIMAYVKIVWRDSFRRRLLAAAANISELANGPCDGSPEELLDLAEQPLRTIAQTFDRNANDSPDMKQVLANVMDRIDTLSCRGGDVAGLSTGFHDLDRMTTGFQPGQVVVIAGRPSMGKTALALNIVEHVAIKGLVAVAVFSLEMPAEELVSRMLASLGRIDQQKVRTGQLADDDWPKLTSASMQLNDATILIDDNASATPTSIAARARAWERQHNIGLIVVDYLQLMQVPGTKENRATEIAAISRGLKVLARELRVPVVALAQLNRNLEQRADRRPRMSDLRESGGIEQDADLILGLYREEVYSPGPQHAGKAELLILKQRNGPIGTVPLTFLGNHVRFENYIPGNRWDPPQTPKLGESNDPRPEINGLECPSAPASGAPTSEARI